MATTQVTLSGNGTLLLKYTEGGIVKSIEVTSPSTAIYLNDSNTPFKYKILSGTPSAPVFVSGSSTFTLITSTYKELVWDFSYQFYDSTFSYYKITGLVVGSTPSSFQTPVELSQVNYLQTAKLVSDEIFKLNNPNITPTSYKETETYVQKQFSLSSITSFNIKSNLVINIEDLTDDIYLKMVNATTGCEYLVKAGGTPSGAVPTNYTLTISPCSINNNNL